MNLLTLGTLIIEFCKSALTDVELVTFASSIICNKTRITSRKDLDNAIELWISNKNSAISSDFHQN